jgi:hypothetical protein
MMAKPEHSAVIGWGFEFAVTEELAVDPSTAGVARFVGNAECLSKWVLC